VSGLGFSGLLETIPLPELLYILSARRHTGRLSLKVGPIQLHLDLQDGLLTRIQAPWVPRTRATLAHLGINPERLEEILLDLKGGTVPWHRSEYSAAFRLRALLTLLPLWAAPGRFHFQPRHDPAPAGGLPLEGFLLELNERWMRVQEAPPPWATYTLPQAMAASFRLPKLEVSEWRILALSDQAQPLIVLGARAWLPWDELVPLVRRLERWGLLESQEAGQLATCA
jgi:hypothetical protein